MPAVSKKQAGFFGAIIAGKARKKHKGLSRSEAREALRGHSTKHLPEQVEGLHRARKSRENKQERKHGEQTHVSTTYNIRFS